MLILYGSHTGQAQSISEQIAERLRQSKVRNQPVRCFALDDYLKKNDLSDEKFAIIIVSSTGDGDPPDNATKTPRLLSKNTHPENFLKNFKYAILGLGDSNYSTYQGFPKKLDKILQGLGAERVLERGEADDQVGLESVVEPWIDNLFDYLVETGEVPRATAENSTETLKIKFNPVKSKEDKEEIARMDEERRRARETEGDDAGEEDVNKKPKLLMESRKIEQATSDSNSASLYRGDEKLSSDAGLRVPVAPEPYLCSATTHEKLPKAHGLPWQNGAKFPGVAGVPVSVKVVGTALLTDEDAHKPKHEMVIDLADHLDKFPYEPGDAFYLIVPNREDEVNFILERLGLLPLADNQCLVSVDPGTSRTGASLPAHIPETSSLRYLFTHCLDIRRVPSRPILRVLADGAKDDGEKRRLLELCSAQGMNDFTQFVRKSGVSLADLLFTFPSVRPSADRLIELLPRLMPRSYSVASFKGRKIRFVYSVLTFPAEEGRRYERKGLATEYLLERRVGETVQVMWKEPSRFRFPPIPSPLPDNCANALFTTPLVMLGPGTGVGVFLSFCQFLLKKKLEDSSKFAASYDANKITRLLFFGCRNKEKDGFYIDEMESYVREGILTNVVICESGKEGEQKMYVQDGVKQREAEIIQLIDAKALIYVCGDAKGMSKDVFQHFTEILAKGKGLSQPEAVNFLANLKKENLYVEDVWS